MNLNTFLQLIPNVFVNTAVTFFIFYFIVEFVLLILSMRSHWKFMFRALPFLKVILNLFLYRLSNWTAFHHLEIGALEENSRNLSAYFIIRDWDLTSGLEFKIDHGQGYSFGFFDFLSTNWPNFVIYSLASFLLAFSSFKLIFFFKEVFLTWQDYHRKLKPYPLNNLSIGIQSQLTKKQISLELLERSNTSPYAIGLWKPKIRLPYNIASTLSQNQIETVILHELAHINRLDLFLMPLLHFFQALIPCIPMRALTLTQEKACDEKVIQKGGSKADLATALRALSLNTQSPNNPLTSPFILKSQTFNRIRHLSLLSFKRQNLGLDIIYTLLLTLLGLFILTSKVGYF